jgi:hypothetical protein
MARRVAIKQFVPGDFACGKARFRLRMRNKMTSRRNVSIGEIGKNSFHRQSFGQEKPYLWSPVCVSPVGAVGDQHLDESFVVDPLDCVFGFCP